MHVLFELDSGSSVFFDDDGRSLLCSAHGARRSVHPRAVQGHAVDPAEGRGARREGLLPGRRLGDVSRS
jgi:hypothetical protein